MGWRASLGDSAVNVAAFAELQANAVDLTADDVRPLLEGATSPALS